MDESCASHVLLQHTRRVPRRYARCAGDQVRVRTRGLEDPRVALAVALSKGLHHAVDLLSLTWQAEAPEELSVRGRTHTVRATRKDRHTEKLQQKHKETAGLKQDRKSVV